MVKVDVVTGKDVTKFYFETRDTSTEGLAELDEVYTAILGSLPKRGGYLDSNKFEVEMLNQGEDESD